MRRLLTTLVLGALACSTSGGAVRSGTPGIPGTTDGSAIGPALVATSYATDSGTDGIVGGPLADDLGRDVLAALRARGDKARPEATLAALGAWYHEQVQAGRNPTSPQSEQAAARLGFVGALHAASVFPIEAVASAPWREVLNQLVRNAPVNRVGVWVSPDGRAAVVVLAAVELTLDPFPRRLARGGALRLHGRVADRFTTNEVFLTPPTGPVQQTRTEGRTLDVTVRATGAGVYRVEVMGDGPSGPVVLGNVPVYVDVPEPDVNSSTKDVAAAGAADGDARMFELLNRARRDAGVPPVAADPELAAVALAYSREMVVGHFFGHVSPVTGTVVDRVRRAGIGVSIVGENVSQGESAEAAHEGLMDSPGHRANMLDPRFTHAGIGVTPTSTEPPLIATIVFARRPTPARLTARDVMARIVSLRREKRVAPVTVDPILQASAEAGMRARAAGGAEPSKEQAMDAGEAALVREDRRLAIRRSGGCAEWLEILELDDLDQVALVVSPGVRKVGLAVALRATGQPPPLAVLLLVEGTGCK